MCMILEVYCIYGDNKIYVLSEIVNLIHYAAFVRGPIGVVDISEMVFISWRRYGTLSIVMEMHRPVVDSLQKGPTVLIFYVFATVGLNKQALSGSETASRPYDVIVILYTGSPTL